MKDNKILLDYKYINIVKDILDNEEFNKIRTIKHHGLTRYGHSLRVSYYSYKITKFCRLDYQDVARAGLLHDFFLTDNQNVKLNTKMSTLINHPKSALKNAKDNFDLTPKEEDIIISHMFPVSIRTPKYLESWIVDLVDNVVAIYERGYIIKKKLLLISNLLFVLFINIFLFK